MNTDGGYIPGSTEILEYYNLVTKGNIPDYVNPKMIAGIAIDIHPDRLQIVRRVYSFSDWLGEVGGFFSAVRAICILVVPLFQRFTLKQYLIGELFKQQPVKHTDVSESRTSY